MKKSKIASIQLLVIMGLLAFVMSAMIPVTNNTEKRLLDNLAPQLTNSRDMFQYQVDKIELDASFRTRKRLDDKELSAQIKRLNNDISADCS